MTEDNLLPLATDLEDVESGWLLTARGEKGISHGESRSCPEAERACHTLQVYSGDSYKTGYLLVDSRGETESLAETQGLMPTLWDSPDGRLWCTTTDPYGDRDREVDLPVVDRSEIEPGMAKRQVPFVGTPIGVVGETAWFENIDSCSPMKPDRLCGIRFTKRGPRRGKKPKIPLPKNNQWAADEAGLHALSLDRDRDTWVHRVFSTEAVLLEERELPIHPGWVSAARLTIGGPSEFLCYGEEGFTWVVVGTDLSVERRHLVGASLDLYYLWRPIPTQTGWLVRFTHEEGNGWLFVRDEAVVDFFLSTETGYEEKLSGRKLKLPKATWTLSGACGVGDGYQVVLYPRAEGAPSEVRVYGRLS